MKSLSTFIVLFFLVLAVVAQMPQCITVEPPGATAYDEITLIFDPEFACFETGSLVGLDSIAIHSGVSYISGAIWKNIVNFDETGINGQATTLYPTDDGRFSITYIPYEFYGFPHGFVITEICAVFNNGTDWTNDGRNFKSIGEECMDLFIPLHYLGDGEIYVPGDYLTIQEGIEAAVDGNKVLVDTGTYYENINFNGKAITVASYFLLDGDTNYTNNTIIDGSQAINPNSASVVIFNSGEDTTSIISGFTITGGNGVLPYSLSARIGGGIFCENSGAKITHNKIIDNEVSHNQIAAGGGIGRIDDYGIKWVIIRNNNILSNLCSSNSGLADGGGIAVTGKVEISNNTIDDNQTYCLTGSARGAGLFHEGHDFTPDSVIIDQNVIKNNLSESDGFESLGGGITVWYSKAFITNNTIINNTVFGECNFNSGGGVAICKNYGELEFSGNLVSENSIPVDTAHIGVGLHIWSPFNKVFIHDNEFIENTAPVFGYNGAGGGISLTDAGDIPVFIERNIFRNNEAWNAGAFYIKFATNVVVINNFFIGNTAFIGGGIGIWQNASTPDYHFELINNTFTANYAETTGGAFRMGGEEGEDIVFINNIFWENGAWESGNSIYNKSLSNTIRIYYSNIDPDDIGGSWAGENNINVNPMIIDNIGHLGWASECVNAGADSLEVDEKWYYSPITDIDGDVRPYLNTMPDIGADEAPYLYVFIDEKNTADGLQIVAYPNPFTTLTTIAYYLQKPLKGQIIIYNHLGEQVKLIQKNQSAGKQQVIWNAEGLASGVYYCVLKTNEGIQTTKMIKLKQQ